MGKLTNYHSHTQFCDAKNTIEELVQGAITEGFSHWGVSPHCPLPMLPSAGWVMREGDVAPYFAEIERLRGLYGTKIEILRGREVDWVDEDFNPAATYFQGMGLDYIIGSVHLLKSPRTGELLDIDCGVEWFERTVRGHFGGSLQRLVVAYYTSMSRMVERGGFTFIGHPDKVLANARILSRNVAQKSWYQGLVGDFLRLCQERKITLEINTKAYPHTGNFFPDQMWWTQMAELEIPAIINSDTHRLCGISTGLREAHSLYRGPIITEL